MPVRQQLVLWVVRIIIAYSFAWLLNRVPTKYVADLDRSRCEGTFHILYSLRRRFFRTASLYWNGCNWYASVCDGRWWICGNLGSYSGIELLGWVAVGDRKPEEGVGGLGGVVGYK
jgi:hypothetical protein